MSPVLVTVGIEASYIHLGADANRTQLLLESPHTTQHPTMSCLFAIVTSGVFKRVLVEWLTLPSSSRRHSPSVGRAGEHARRGFENSLISGMSEVSLSSSDEAIGTGRLSKCNSSLHLSHLVLKRFPKCSHRLSTSRRGISP